MLTLINIDKLKILLFFMLMYLDDVILLVRYGTLVFAAFLLIYFTAIIFVAPDAKYAKKKIIS